MFSWEHREPGSVCNRACCEGGVMSPWLLGSGRNSGTSAWTGMEPGIGAEVEPGAEAGTHMGSGEGVDIDLDLGVDVNLDLGLDMVCGMGTGTVPGARITACMASGTRT